MARTLRRSTLLALLLLTGVSCRFEERSPDDAPPPDAPGLPPGELPVVPPGAGEMEGPREAPRPVMDVGDAYWAGEGTAGAEVTGTFVSREALTAYLDRSAPVGHDTDGRAWVLADILVSVEFPGAGERAIWRVAGPREVIAIYLDRLREEERRRERTPVRDLGILELEVRHFSDAPPARVRPPAEESDRPR